MGPAVDLFPTKLDVHKDCDNFGFGIGNFQKKSKDSVRLSDRGLDFGLESREFILAL